MEQLAQGLRATAKPAVRRLAGDEPVEGDAVCDAAANYLLRQILHVASVAQCARISGERSVISGGGAKHRIARAQIAAMTSRSNSWRTVS